MIDIPLDRNDKRPLFIQIRDGIIHLIASGVLKKGNQLPSSRALAEHLQVNRTTVYQAYRELWSLGYTESRPGSYSVVRDRKKTNQPVDTASSPIDWDNLINHQYEVPYKTVPEPEKNYFDFRTFSPASARDAAENFRKCLNDVLKEKGKDLLLYGDSYGYRPLRAYIAGMMSDNEIDADIDRILITDGAQNGLDLICKLFRKPGWKIITADPTYSEALSLFRYYDADVISSPIGPEGIDTEQAEKILNDHEISFLYTMPNYQNPTGITSSQRNRERLLEICEKAGVPIIEDGFSQDMRGTILPIKSMDRNGIVLYVGTFSKVLFPGIRTGWINGNGKIVKKLAALQYMTSVSGNHIMQAAVERFCRLGYYDLHLKRIHRFYSERMETALTLLRKDFPREAGEFTAPSGGFYLWFRMSERFQDEMVLIDRLKDRGILITGGSAFTVREKGVCLRMSLARGRDSRLEEGLKSFCSAVRDLI